MYFPVWRLFTISDFKMLGLGEKSFVFVTVQIYYIVQNFIKSDYILPKYMAT